MTFPSKTGPLWWSTIAFVVLACALCAYLARSQPGSMIFSTVIGVLVTGFCLWIGATTRYIVADEKLTIRSGPFTWVIPLESVQSVTPTNNPISSPALSLDRLEIKHTNGSVLVSPRDKAGLRAAIGHPASE